MYLISITEKSKSEIIVILDVCTVLTFWAAPALQTARETPRIALAPSLAKNKTMYFQWDFYLNCTVLNWQSQSLCPLKMIMIKI